MKEVNEFCAQFLKTVLDAGLQYSVSPKEFDVMEVSIQQPLAQDSATIRVSL